jgi:putative transposase
MINDKSGTQRAPLQKPEGGQRPPLPRRKHIRLPREAYANPASIFNITIDALERRKHFDVSSFNDDVVAQLRGLALQYRCPIRIYCLMPTHLHLIMKPGIKSVVDFIGEFKKRTADLARETRVIEHLWQRSFFDHRLRSLESEVEQIEYIRVNPVRAGLVAQPDDWPWTGSVG